MVARTIYQLTSALSCFIADKNSVLRLHNAYTLKGSFAGIYDHTLFNFHQQDHTYGGNFLHVPPYQQLSADLSKTGDTLNKFLRESGVW